MTRADDTPPSSRHPDRLHDLDSDIDELAAGLASSTHPEQRASIHERMVLRALPLADTIAGRYRLRGIETDDLVQVGRTALVKAVHRYRPGTGSGFCAFAVPTISGELKRWFRDQGWSVRPPRRVQELRSSLMVEEERLRHALERQPRDCELAAELGVSPDEVAEARLCSGSYRAASLDVVTPWGSSLADHVAVEESAADAIVLLHALGWAVARLSPRQQLLLRLRFVDELTQQQIGQQLGVSQMQVSRLLRGALDRLRADLESDRGLRRSVA
jgi:RNA polymerase sigma-B factor